MSDQGSRKLEPFPITDLVTGIVAGYLKDVDLTRAQGKSGRVRVQVEVCLDRGEVPWSTGSVTFEERRKYD